jgi:hypothetical protein
MPGSRLTMPISSDAMISQQARLTAWGGDQGG